MVDQDLQFNQAYFSRSLLRNDGVKVQDISKEGKKEKGKEEKKKGGGEGGREGERKGKKETKSIKKAGRKGRVWGDGLVLSVGFICM